MSELITDEMVEAAARAVWNADPAVAEGDWRGWDDDPAKVSHDQERDVLRGEMRAALEAAAPLIAGRALSQAADDWQRGEWADAPRYADPAKERIANAQHVTDWLRARSEKEAGRG